MSIFKTLTLSTLIVLGSFTLTSASPLLTWDLNDPSENVTSYHIYGITPSPIEVAAPPYDLADLPPGTYTVNITAINGVWGLESAPSDPLDFSKPTSVSVPANVRLTDGN
jgi:hypothetical protein